MTIKKELNKLSNKLNYKIKNYDDRYDIVHDIIYTQKRKVLDDVYYDWDNFFIDYFTNYFNVNLSQDKGLSDKNPVCYFLYRLALYLENSSDKKSIEEKRKERYLKHKNNKNQVNFDTIPANSNMRHDEHSQSCRDKHIAYSISDKDLEPYGGNYKKSIEQKIYQKDLENFSILQQYQKSIDWLIVLLQLSKIDYDIKLYRKILYMLSSLKDDQKWIKDYLLNTIYFKDVLPDNGFSNSSSLELDLFQLEDCKILLKILSFSKISGNIDKYLKIFSVLEWQYLKLNDKEKKIIDLLRKGKFNRYRILNTDYVQTNYKKRKKQKSEYQKAFYKVSEIAKELHLDEQDTYRLFNNLARKTSVAYEKWYEDNVYYLHLVKGKFKKCSRCGEIKLINRFSPDSSRKDGYSHRCKICDSKRKM